VTAPGPVPAQSPASTVPVPAVGALTVPGSASVARDGSG